MSAAQPTMLLFLAMLLVKQQCTRFYYLPDGNDVQANNYQPNRITRLLEQKVQTNNTLGQITTALNFLEYPNDEHYNICKKS